MNEAKNKEKVKKMKNVTQWTMKKKFLKRRERKRSKTHDVKKEEKK